MRVLFLIDTLGMGGAERQFALLASRLPARVERRVWSMAGGPFVGPLEQAGIEVDVRPRRARFDVAPTVALWRRIREWKPDLVHSWGWMSTLSAGPMCRLLGVPLIDGTIRTGGRQSEFFALKRLGMWCSRLVVANTRAGLKAWGVDAKKGRVVMNGFDDSRLRQSEVAAGHDGAPPMVVMTGRMEPEKDFEVLLEAARALNRAGRPCRLLLVGQGSRRDGLMHEARDLVAAGLAEFPEAGLEVLELVRRAQIGVLMTRPAVAQEGCSNSIMEYMACGLPVVCGEGGGNREVVEDGKTGFVVPPANAAALAERLAYLLDHPAERAALGAAGKARIASRFSVEGMVAGFLDLYSEALA